jgi:pimeloyl-ACP methyl ester carboxylesterase
LRSAPRAVDSRYAADKHAKIEQRCIRLLRFGAAPRPPTRVSESGLEMATGLRSLNPLVRIEQVQGAGHGLPFEQPESLGEVVVSFLRELA